MSSAQVVAPERAFASLGSGGPAVVAVTERYYANATEQEISLRTAGPTPGQNTLRVQILGQPANSARPMFTLKDEPLTEIDLASEAQNAIPQAEMRVSLNDVRNRYGPFGYAFGRSREGDACLYAWQRLRTPDARLSVFVSRTAIALRLRLCEPGGSEASLLAPMMSLGLNATIPHGNWNRDNSPLQRSAVVPTAPAAAFTAISSTPVRPAPPPWRPAIRPRIDDRAASARGTGRAAPLPPFAADVVVPPPPADDVPPSPVPPLPAASSGPGTHR